MVTMIETPALIKEIEKLWKSLKNSPEKGHVLLVETYYDEAAHATKNVYEPTLEEFKKQIYEKMEDTNMFPPEEDYGWAYKISEIKKSYGVGPSFNDSSQKESGFEGVAKWWQKQKTHMSKDGKYYVVPLVFEDITKNINLIEYKQFTPATPDGKYKIGEYGQAGTLLGTPDFTDKCKMWALGKLKRDLDKAVGSKQLDVWSKKFGIIPKNKKAKGKTMVESWNMLPRNPAHQTLWIKVMFDASWVNSLPPKDDESIDYSAVSNEVMIFAKDFKTYLKNLETILSKFDAQINIAEAESGVNVSFKGSCVIENIRQISDSINSLLLDNKKDNLETLEKTNGAFQFGFTKDFALQYVAYSEIADCLCEDDSDMNAYALRTSLESLKSEGPFTSATINNFVYLLPAINRRYSRYLKTTNKESGDLFGTEQSWLNFVNTYVHPQPEVSYSGAAASDFQKGWMTTLKIGEQLKNQAFKDLLFTGKYVQDPLHVLGPDVKNLIAGVSNVTYMESSDENMLQAVVSEIQSLTSMYDKMLNKIPISELIKIASTILFKCIDNDTMRKELCGTTLKTLPIAEIRQQLYPCLRDLGAPGELAIAKLEEKITGRTGMVYKVAMDRYPDKFSQTDDAGEQAKALSKLTSLYCSDPFMQKKLGRSPDDFSDELAKWAEDQANDAICDCILTLYGPVTQLLEISQEVAEGVVDGMLSGGKDKAHNIDKEATLALDRIVDPIKNFLNSRNKMNDLKKAFTKGMQDMAMNLVFASVLVLLKWIKDEVHGSLTKDMCNSSDGKNVFSTTSLEEMLMNSTLYEDGGQEQIWDKFKDMKAEHFFNQDIQKLVDGFNEIGNICSPREIKRVFTTGCGDYSINSTYSTIALGIMSEETKNQLAKDFPGESLDSIAGSLGYTPGNRDQATKEDSSGKRVPYDLPPDFVSPQQVHDALADIGEGIDPNIFEENIENYDEAQKQLASLCDPETLSILADTLDEEDIANLAAGDKESVMEDLLSWLPFLDKERMQDMYPPLFCGPCSPKQVGKKPMMKSQTHPTQLFMQQKLNDHTYKVIDDAFNNNLSVYKPLVRDGKSSIPNVINKLIEGMPSKLDDPTQAQEMYGAAVGKMLEKIGEESSGGDFKFVAEDFRKTISEMVAGLDQLKNFDPKKKIAEFSYVLENTPYTIWVIFNFSDDEHKFRDQVVYSPQIRLFCYNGDILEYKFPLDDAKVKDFNFDDVGNQLFKYFSNVDGPQGKIISAALNFFGIQNETAKDLFQSLYPIASNLILETVWTNIRNNELLLYENFNSMPLTNAEALEKCSDTDTTPLLNVDQLKQDIEEFRESLECTVSMFATPDAMQIANLCGLYKILIKAIIVEEFLKNIFMFTFAKISDVIEDPEYMVLAKQNIKSTLESTLSTGYDNLLTYSEKLINGRTLLLDPEDLDTMKNENGELLSEAEKIEMMRIKSSEECLDVIIVESAREIDNILDIRVREHIDKSWKDKFVDMEDVGKSGAESYFTNGFFNYAVHSAEMDNTKYPSRKYISGGKPNSGDAELTVGKLPSFETIEVGANILPENTDGGLYYEPFVRMKSKLATDPGTVDDIHPNFIVFEDDDGSHKIEYKVDHVADQESEYFLQAFWKKFKTAYEYWEKATFRHAGDVNIDKGKMFSSLNGEKMHKDIWKGPASWPRGYQYGGQPHDSRVEEFSHINDFFKDLIAKIDSEFDSNGVLVYKEKNGDKSTFLDFFLVFFSPLTYDGKRLSPENPGRDYGARGYGSTRTIFQSIISSHRDTNQTPPYNNFMEVGPGSGDTFDWGQLTEYKEYLGNNPSGANFLDAFYYWQHYPDGVIPVARRNFKGRGVMNLADFIAEEHYDNYDGTYERARQSFWFGSNPIDTIAGAREVNILVGDNGDLNDPGGLNEYYLDTIQEFMTRHGFSHFQEEGLLDDVAGAIPGSETPAENNNKYSGLFYNWLKSTIVEAPYDLWFDFSLGMRMNLVIPYDTDTAAPLSQEYIKGKINELTDISKITAALGTINDRDYNLDKAFIISEPSFTIGENAYADLNFESSKKWLCIPIENIEYNLWDYWKEIHSATQTGTLSLANQHDLPISKEYTALKNGNDFLYPADNPWNVVMKDIINMGAKSPTTTAFSKYNHYSARDSAALVFYSNVHAPISIDNSAMKEGLTSNEYYKNAAGPSNFVRPTLYAACKMIKTSLSKTVYLPKSTLNETRIEVVDLLKKKLIKELIEGENKLFNEVMPVKESVLTTAIIYRYAMQSAYPSLNNLFSPTKMLISSFITQSIKSIEGDYSYVNSVMDEASQEEKLNSSAPSAQDVAEMFFKLIVQMAANIGDPTWKTPWFFPGPLTPVGVIAKLISRSDKDDPKKESIIDEKC